MRAFKFTQRLATITKSRHAGLILAVVAFSEALFFPLPPDLLLIPFALANYRKAFRLAFITTVFSVLGGCLGYFIGVYFYEELGKPILVWFGSEEYFTYFSIRYNEFGTIAVIMGGLTPIPYKLVTILSGATAMPISEFIWASFVSRGIRFFLLAILIYIFHKQALELINRYFTPFIIFVAIGLLVIFLTLKIL